MTPTTRSHSVTIRQPDPVRTMRESAYVASACEPMGFNSEHLMASSSSVFGPAARDQAARAAKNHPTQIDPDFKAKELK